VKTDAAVAESPAKTLDQIKGLPPVVGKGTDAQGLDFLDVEVGNKVYRVRQILVEESDSAYDAATDESTGKFNWRFNTRLLLSSTTSERVDGESIPVGVDEIAKWPGVRLAALIRVYDKLNILPAADPEGNV
jgi:hypothetical protein